MGEDGDWEEEAMTRIMKQKRAMRMIRTMTGMMMNLLKYTNK
jgi:hypothetical protein